MRAIRSTGKGFTLVELLVVIAIIGLLSSAVFAGLNSARVKARDAKRVLDLRTLQTALELYYDRYGTYLVAGAGWRGGGQGWVGYEGGSDYVKSLSRALQEEGFLSAPRVDDPVQNPGYMIYLCESNKVYALSATKENPTAGDIAFIQITCNGTGANGTYTRYGKNYAVANKTY